MLWVLKKAHLKCPAACAGFICIQVCGVKIVGIHVQVLFSSGPLTEMEKIILRKRGPLCFFPELFSNPRNVCFPILTHHIIVPKQPTPES